MSALRRIVLAAFLAGATLPIAAPSPAAAVTAELFFSEYIEGTSNNKALEIYNGTGAAIDLSVDGYTVDMYFNGSAAIGLTIALTGTVADGDVYVVAQSLASATILEQADQTNAAGWYNGDDAVVLHKGNAVVDAIGQAGFDPGTEWGSGLNSTADNTLRRDPSVCAGDTVHNDIFDPNVGWVGFATDTFDGLGAHIADCRDEDLAPAVASSNPANNASNVALGSNIDITFSEPVAAGASAFAVVCTTSGPLQTTLTGGPSTFTLDPVADFAEGESCTVTVAAGQVTDLDDDDPPDTMAADHSFAFTAVQPLIPIHDIQGASHRSALDGDPVTTTGIVTAKSGNSFYMQDPAPDANEATSEAIFVFRLAANSVPIVQIGDAVRVSGTVSEFRPGGTAGAVNLTTTEIVTPTVAVVTSGNALPQPTVIGDGGRVPPTQVIDDDATGDVETSGTFDATTDGIDFYESLEAMRVQVNDPVAVGPTSGFGEIFVVGDGGEGASVRTARDGVLVRANDFNPERIALDDTLLATPDVNVGDTFTAPAVGVLDYSFGNFKLNITEPLEGVDNGLEPEVAKAPTDGQLAVATFNVENLDAAEPPAKFDALADQIVNHLLSPDIVALEEIQDNNGAANDGTVDASATLAGLVDAIAAVGGPTYDWRQIDPVNNADGGEPGGNIRVGFLFRTDRGLEFVDRPGGTSTDATGVIAGVDGPELTFSPGRIDPTNVAWNTSRKPLVGEFTYEGETLFVIVNHFNSKGGDQPLFGHFQPPVRVTEAQRHQQAQLVNDFVDDILAVDDAANVIVLGDINDFAFSETVSILKGDVLLNLMDTLPADQRYSYVFEGNSQVLDQILVSDGLASRGPVFDPVHINAEFFDQQSDHDPSVAILDFNDEEEFWDFDFVWPGRNDRLTTYLAGIPAPIIFRVGADRGGDVLAGNPTSVRIDCATGAPIGSTQPAVSFGGLPLIHSPNSEIYTYLWQTQRSWRGTCRMFTLALADGTTHTALFRFLSI